MENRKRTQGSDHVMPIKSPELLFKTMVALASAFWHYILYVCTADFFKDRNSWWSFNHWKILPYGIQMCPFFILFYDRVLWLAYKGQLSWKLNVFRVKLTRTNWVVLMEGCKLFENNLLFHVICIHMNCRTLKKYMWILKNDHQSVSPLMENESKGRWKMNTPPPP